MSAFLGDPAIRAMLLARIDAHIAGTTLDLSGATLWDGVRGSPLGVSVEGSDPVDYARMFGYPVALAAALDMLAAQAEGRGEGRAFVRQWVADVPPGAELAGVPAALMLYLLAAPERDGRDAAIHGELVALHGLSAAGRPAGQDRWRAIRRTIVARADALADPALAPLQALWEAACWPADQGRSTLVGAITAWRRLDRPRRADWSDRDEARALAILNALWVEHAASRDTDDEPNYMALFRARDPDLAERFGRSQQLAHDQSVARSADLARHCLAELADAGERTHRLPAANG